jgi:hypothetical protein
VEGNIHILEIKGSTMTHAALPIIELKPEIDNHFVCPECHTRNPVIEDVLIQPVCVFADCLCTRCGLKFFQTFSIGHTVDEHLSVSKTEGKLYINKDESQWLSDTVSKTRHLVKDGDVTIERKIFKPCRRVVILNTLDYLYGHVLLKLLNADYHLKQQKSLGLIVIVPRIFEWLIPKGCTEAWIVDLKLSELAYGHDSIQKFILKQFDRFDRVYLSKAYSHPDCSKVDISSFTGVKPFNLNFFNDLRPTFTFVLRQDRWWFPSILDYWFYRVCRKLKILSWGSRILSLRQNWLVKKTIRAIQKKIPDSYFTIVGLGKAGKFGKPIGDHRQTDVTVSTETDWCRIYSRSHVVIGVHGSNMLLPTALSAGCVQILPEDRYGNMIQDIAVRYNDRKQLFFYRFSNQFARSCDIATKAVSIVRDFKEFNKNMCVNVYTPK